MPEVYDAYKDDPDVVFILTERTPESWAKSMRGSGGEFLVKAHSFPFKYVKYFDSFLWELLPLVSLLFGLPAKGAMPWEPEIQQNLERHYTD